MTENPLFDPAARLVIAHRGNRVAAPENTMEALAQAAELGVDALEFDVRMTRDGVPVLMHDARLDRTTAATGLLSAYTLSELAGVDAGARFAGKANGKHAIPTLEEVLDRFRELPLVIEVKEFAAVQATHALIQRFNAQSRVLVGSAETRVMEWFYRSGLRTCASMLDAALLIPFAVLGLRPLRPPYDVLSITTRFKGFPVPIRQMAASVRRAGIPTQVWTVNDPVEARSLWQAGVAAIVSDDPAAMLRARAG